MAKTGLSTLLLEGGGPSYGITGGDLNARRPAWLNETFLTRVDVPGLYSSIFANGGNLICGSLTMNAYGGCTIGGGSAINAGLFFEPPASDWDLYFPLGWKSSNMTTAIKRLYHMLPGTNLTSQDGKRYLQSGYYVARNWLVHGLGFKDVDINGQADDKTGVFGHPIYFYSRGERSGPVTTYLQEALRLSNFRLQSGTRAVRVKQRSGNATGVVVLIDGKETLIKLSNLGRVILSAGAIQSPGLLMFSGIGDPQTLLRLQQNGKLDGLDSAYWINSTAVGANLFDNPNTFIELESNNVTSYVYSYDNPPPRDKGLYLQHRSGPYTFAGQTSVFWDTIRNLDGTITGLQGTIGSSGYQDFLSNNTITMNVYGTSGLKSRGRVVLDNNFIPGPSGDVIYSNPLDAENIATFIHKIFQGLPNAGITPLNIPQNSTIDDIVDYITTPSPYARGFVNHWSSSCAIGSCVDVNAMVKGTKNIHVVDGSIVAPFTVNPQFGIMAAAERAAELILGY